jgi:hypothetical protein
MTIRTASLALAVLALAAFHSPSAVAAAGAEDGQLPPAAAAPSPAAATQSPVAAAASPVAAAANASAGATPSPIAEDPAITAAVKREFLAWQAGKIDRSVYSAEMNKALPDSAVANVSAQLRSLGAPTKFVYLDRTSVSENRAYTYGADTPKAKLRILYVLDTAGKISGLWFRPAP